MALARNAEVLGGDDVSRAILESLVEALGRAPLDGFEPESGEVLEAACVELEASLNLAERAANGVSDELRRRFFTHAGTPAPLSTRARAR